MTGESDPSFTKILFYDYLLGMLFCCALAPFLTTLLLESRWYWEVAAVLISIGILSACAIAVRRFRVSFLLTVNEAYDRAASVRAMSVSFKEMSLGEKAIGGIVFTICVGLIVVPVAPMIVVVARAWGDSASLFATIAWSVVITPLLVPAQRLAKFVGVSLAPR